MRRVAVVASVAAVLSASCAAEQLDPGRVEQAIADEVPEAGFTEVQCPQVIEAAAGASFECVAAGPGGVYVIVEVSQQDDAGSVSFRFGRGLVRTEDVADLLDADVEATLDAEVELDCPAVVVLADETGSFTCTGVDEGGEAFEIEVQVDDGAVSPDGWDFIRGG